MTDGLCCRCGRRPRDRETLLCGDCLNSPTARFEIRTLLDSGDPLPVQRRRAVRDFHWAGGWPKGDWTR